MRSKSRPTARECAQQRDLADADVSFEQYVPAHEQRHVDEPEGVGLTDHGLRDFGLQAQGIVAPIVEPFVARLLDWRRAIVHSGTETLIPKVQVRPGAGSK